MARTKRSAKLDSKKSRLTLELGKRHVDTINPGEYVIYRRPINGSAGSWSARRHEETTGAQPQIRLGTADDFSDADGELILSFTQAQDKAKKWFTECEAARKATDQGEIIATGPYTVGDAIDDYIKDGKRRDMKSVDKTEQSAQTHIIRTLGAVEVTRLTRTRIETWLSGLAESPRRVRTKKGAKEPAFSTTPHTADEKRARKDTANRILTILKAALNHALDRGKVDGSGAAWRAVKPYANVASTRIRFLQVEDQQRLVNACPPDFRRLVQAALFTGARYGELTRLQVKDFNPEPRTLFIAESKSGKARQVYLTDEAVSWLTPLTIARPSGDLIFARDSVKRRAREGKLAHDNAWAQCDQQRPMDEACKNAGLDPVRFHELRHSYASGLVNKGVPLVFVAYQLGHSDTRMVEKHYGHLAPNAMATAIRTLAPMLGIADPSYIEAIKLSARLL
jgi:integrase